MRYIAAALCILIVAGSIALLHAQQPAPPFRGGVSLVTVDVTVLDKEGRPVPGLAAEDFQVKLNGKVQPIRALSYLEARTDTTESVPAPKGPVMPQMFPVADVKEAPPGGTESRVFVLLVDDLSFPATGGLLLAALTATVINALAVPPLPSLML